MTKLTGRKKGKKDKHDIYNRIISILLILVYLTGLLPAQEISHTINESKNRLDYYLDKAELEYEESSWEEKAQTGLQEALSYWESENTYLKENDYEEYTKQKKDAQLYLEMEKNRSYVEWLCSKVNRASTARVSSELAGKLKEARAGYDTKGYSLNESAKLQTAWEEESERIINSYLDKFDTEQMNLLPEIKERLKAKGISEEEAEKIYSGVSTSSREVVRKENLSLSKSEGSRLIVRFLEDKESVKAGKAGEAAKVIAKDLADSALTESEAAMEELFTNLEKTLKSESTEEDVTDLLENFKSVFNKGLAVWEEAETEFLKSRQEWEEEASETYKESEEKWAEAYAELMQKRIEWEESINDRIQQTQKDIEERNRDYENQISGMYNSYAAVLENDKARMVQIAESQISQYKGLRSGLVMAKEGIESWYGVWNTYYKGLYSYWKTEDNGNEEDGETKYIFDVESFTEEKAAELKKELAAIVNSWLPEETDSNSNSRVSSSSDSSSEKNSDSNDNSVLEIIFIPSYKKDLQNIVKNNRTIFKDSKNPLKSDLSNLDKLITLAQGNTESGILEENLKALRTAADWIDQIIYYKKQIREVEKSIYNTTGKNENITFKTELETQISEAEKLVNYWEEEVYVARKVEEYAKTTDASRDTSEKTLKDKETAEKAYNDAIENYKTESGLLNDLNAGVEKAAAELNTKTSQLSKKREEM